MTNEEFIKKLSEMENTLPISNELANLMDYITNKLSKELPTLTIDLDYFILGVFSQKDNFTFKRLTDSLTSSSIDAIYSSYYQVISSKALTAIKIGRKITIDNLFSELFIKAMEEARSLGDEALTSEHIFLSILAYDDENNKTKKVFNKAGITYSIFKSKLEDKFNNITENNSTIIPKVKIIGNIENEEEARKIIQTLFNSNDNIEFLDHNSLPGMPKLKKGKDVHIKTYCTNLNDLAEQGKIGPLIGRDKEINEIIRILGRKKKNNTILLGGEGVGKTVIGESLALKIVNNEVPDFLSKRILVSLDMTALMAGTTLRGMFEERVKGILDEIKANPNYILFMDNIGAILADKGKNDYEISSMLAGVGRLNEEGL